MLELLELDWLEAEESDDSLELDSLLLELVLIELLELDWLEALEALDCEDRLSL